ncbi:uncharacterized protein BDW70DRAFT_158563 [Aspergillus foveolatus]|uniref:uncharacterized protein n=1 Tax=Aspergillus foveolatus TaxID=210207 RepID=UPI003CCDEA16
MADVGHDHDHIDSDPGPLYQEAWTQKLLRQIQACLQINSDWLGIDPSRSQRILDYAVCRYNDEATKLLGDPHYRMFATQGDLYDPQPVVSEAEWSGFDAAIISFALHHTKDPVEMLTRPRRRVRPGGTVIVLDFIRHADTASLGQAREEDQKDKKYRAEHMVKLPQGMKI